MLHCELIRAALTATALLCTLHVPASARHDSLSSISAHDHDSLVSSQAQRTPTQPQPAPAAPSSPSRLRVPTSALRQSPPEGYMGDLEVCLVNKLR